ncbi:MAG: hypothetical protein IPN26_01190 [Bacteroidetes bacterium]|nr:hypothetical protein [Bacteroidota bacterium]
MQEILDKIAALRKEIEDALPPMRMKRKTTGFVLGSKGLVKQLMSEMKMFLLICARILVPD